MSPRRKGPKTDADEINFVVLRLYIAGGAPNSMQALVNIKEILREHLPGNHKLEIVDVLLHPERAMSAGILVTPTLVKLSPLPAVQIVGNLSDKPKVFLAIGIRI